LELSKISLLPECKQPITIILSARSKSQLEEVATSCRIISPQSTFIVQPLDLADIKLGGATLDAYLQSIKKSLQNNQKKPVIDVLINNAGISSRGSAVDTTLETLRSVMDVNFFGTAALTQSICRQMIQNGSSNNNNSHHIDDIKNDGQLSSSVHKSIAVISSVQGRLAVPYRSSYSASKHAVQGYFDSLRGELVAHNISVTVISPGYVQTSLSLNAITENGSKHGKMDEATKLGMTSEYCARESLLAIALKLKDCLICETKVHAAVQGRWQFPDLIAMIMAKRGAQ
jgi:short-subunit dehydrogenase